jgi:hypothetical protein
MSGVIKLSLREIEDLRCRLMVVTTDQEINCAVCAGRSTWFCALTSRFAATIILRVTDNSPTPVSKYIVRLRQGCVTEDIEAC